MRALRVHRLRIGSYRAIQQPIDLDFCAPSGEPGDVVVLAGPNGSGKTSILEAIAFAVGRPDLVPRALPTGAVVEAWVTFDGKTEPVAFRPENFTLVDEERPIEFFSSWRSPALVGAIKPLAGPGGRPTDTEHNRLWRLKQRINDERARVAFQNGAGRESRADEWLELINRAWEMLHGDGTRIEAQLADPNADDVRADLYLVRDDQRLCAVDELSSGEIELLTLAGAVVLNKLNDGLVLIDEPELHLHPEWQAAILPALRILAPRSQFIVATHSDTIWDRAVGHVQISLMPRRSSAP